MGWLFYAAFLSSFRSDFVVRKNKKLHYWRSFAIFLAQGQQDSGLRSCRWIPQAVLFPPLLIQGRKRWTSCKSFCFPLSYLLVCLLPCVFRLDFPLFYHQYNNQNHKSRNPENIRKNVQLSVCNHLTILIKWIRLKTSKVANLACFFGYICILFKYQSQNCYYEQAEVD